LIAAVVVVVGAVVVDVVDVGVVVDVVVVGAVVVDVVEVGVVVDVVVTTGAEVVTGLFALSSESSATTPLPSALRPTS
jgi:hypothetical protein